MDKDTQLPAEVAQSVYDESLKAYPYKDGYDTLTTPGLTKLIDVNANNRKVWLVGATEYAIKLHQCDKSNKALEEKNRELAESNAIACNLLKELISSKSFPKLLNWNLFEKIKTFLDGK